MGHVIVWILKIIGIILLIILGILLLILFSVLFVPVRYRMEIQKQQEIRAHAKLSWLLGIFSVPVDYGEDGLHVRFQVFGFQVKDFLSEDEPKEKKPKKRKQKEKQEKKAQLQPEDAQTQQKIPGSENVSNQEKVREPEEISKQEKIPEPEDIPKQEKIPKHASGRARKKTAAEGKKFSPARIVSGFLEKLKKLKYTICSFCDKMKAAIQKAGSFRNFLLLESTRAALGTCGAQILFLLKKLAPRHVRGWVHFGMEDPALTGQILGGISACYGMFPWQLDLQPDFTQQILEGELLIKGHLHLISAVQIAWRIWRDKNVMSSYRKIRDGF